MVCFRSIYIKHMCIACSQAALQPHLLCICVCVYQSCTSSVSRVRPFWFLCCDYFLPPLVSLSLSRLNVCIYNTLRDHTYIVHALFPLSCQQRTRTNKRFQKYILGKQNFPRVQQSHELLITFVGFLGWKIYFRVPSLRFS